MNDSEESLYNASSADSPIVIVTTVASTTDAKKIIEILIGEKLAACISQFPITSTYFWEGEIKTESEIQLVAKTAQKRAQALMKRIQAIHPYSTPEILEIKIHSASKPYAKWVQEMTQK
jgi:periplasmic divalent cation tolerance protein